MIEQNVTSFELSKKLKELRVPQKSCFFWIKKLNCKPHIAWHASFNKIYHKDNFWSAYLASELLEIIPEKYIDEYHNYMSLHLKKDDGSFFSWYEENYFTQYFGEDYYMTKSTNPCDSLAKFLIHLIENGLVKL